MGTAAGRGTDLTVSVLHAASQKAQDSWAQRVAGNPGVVAMWRFIAGKIN